MLDEKNELHNRSMHISGMFEDTNIESAKVDIEKAEADIERVLTSFIGQNQTDEWLALPYLLWRRGKWTSCLHEWTFDDR